jgi:hypothetical protein
VYKGICQLCQQPVNVPFSYMGKTFSAIQDTRSTKAHVVSQRDGGKWSNGNIFEAHMYCNNLMVSVCDIEWVISTFFAAYTTIATLRAKLHEADTLYRKVQEALDGKRTVDAEILAVLKPVAHRILTDSQSNMVKRLTPNRRETIVRLAA